MNLRTVGAGLPLALLLAGCGGHGTPAKSSASPNAGTGDALRRLAQCARANGQPNFPDPVQNSDGTWGFPPSGGGQRLPEACASLKAQAGQQSRPSPVSSADLARLRQYAACLRRSGLPDWPDPDSDGAFTLPPRLQGLGKSTIVAKLKPCQKYSPGRVKFKTSPGGGQ
ncbi:hypothetical protein GCM10009527_022070 [Actinomadura nitritigenes]|uniref:Lipoprotein n=1 Tax=Actinomadura nitritigenes TaxID=134602 RepID=A0ABS3REC4_9ACTN|nr:hypothetical protein [Actinomadura nitritigenes]MBO2444455.1 hypothetical protein [Actinomadura nitritigenes]